MKKHITAVVLSLAILSLSSCSSPSSPPSSASPESSSISSGFTSTSAPDDVSSPESPSPTPDSSESKSDRMVGIKGSYIKDIQIGVSNFGMDDNSAEGAPDEAPYRWTATKNWNFPETTVLLDYSIIGDDDSQLISGSFGTTWDAVMDNEVFITASEYYLGFIATMPYDSSDPEATKQWVLDNLATVASSDPVSTTIGDAVFTLSGTNTPDGTPSSYLLQIQVVASES